MPNSRLAEFYKKSIKERLKVLNENGFLSDNDLSLLIKEQVLLTTDLSNKMIENVVSVFGLPMGLGLNFLVNGKDYIVPMVVEEPSIVAAVSSMAKIVREAGGFISESSNPVLTGQVQVVNIENFEDAKNIILGHKDNILKIANDLHPNMVKRGGGAFEVEVRMIQARNQEMLIVHLHVNVRDAMGANLVNSMCEAVASYIEEITQGKVLLRILSNLTDRSIVKTSCTIPYHLLERKGYSGEEVRDGIILANDFALADPYRAATHNKGIMNGIDPLIIATGNDWRAIEAGAHAYAAKDGQYKALTMWDKNGNGDLVGEIEIPVRVGIVGGSLESNPAVGIAHRILGIKSANELAEVVGAVGLAQNLGAIRALATKGIQSGHMSLHARSVVNTAGASPDIHDEVVSTLLKSGEIKVWKAKEIIDEIKSKAEKVIPKKDLSSGFGKIILTGEHAVVYGSHAIAAPIPIAMQAKVSSVSEKGVRLVITDWNVNETLNKDHSHKYSLHQSLDLILSELELKNQNMSIEVIPNIPKAMGLGGSAALAVAIIRALSKNFRLNLKDQAIADLAFKSENIMHGTASGIDNTLATYGNFIKFKKGTPPLMVNIAPKEPLPIVIGLTNKAGLTVEMVGKVRSAWKKDKKMYEHIFNDINELTLQSEEAIKKADFKKLGELMNINHGYLNALQVSSKELEELIEISRTNGALGAKLTGGGGGGAMIALCPNNSESVAKAINKAGYKTIITQIK